MRLERSGHIIRFCLDPVNSRARSPRSQTCATEWPALDLWGRHRCALPEFHRRKVIFTGVFSTPVPVGSSRQHDTVVFRGSHVPEYFGPICSITHSLPTTSDAANVAKRERSFMSASLGAHTYSAAAPAILMHQHQAGTGSYLSVTNQDIPDSARSRSLKPHRV